MIEIILSKNILCRTCLTVIEYNVRKVCVSDITPC